MCNRSAFANGLAEFDCRTASDRNHTIGVPFDRLRYRFVGYGTGVCIMAVATSPARRSCISSPIRAASFFAPESIILPPGGTIRQLAAELDRLGRRGRKLPGWRHSRTKMGPLRTTSWTDRPRLFGVGRLSARVRPAYARHLNASFHEPWTMGVSSSFRQTATDRQRAILQSAHL